MRNLFSEIADVYDRMNRLLSLGMDRRRRRLAAAGATVRPSRALEFFPCCTCMHLVSGNAAKARQGA